MILDEDIKKVIAESVDGPLGLVDFVDKEKFYRTLEAKYGLKVEDIPVKYELFHNVLSEMFGLKHYAVERKIVEVLHRRSKMRVYDETREIPAFVVVVKSYMSEVDQKVSENEAQIEKNLKTLAKIRKNQA